MPSPAFDTSRPFDSFDMSKPGEYPIVLGSSLKGTPDSLTNIRYNWQPKSGLQDFRSKLTSEHGGYHLAVTAGALGASSFSYEGHTRADREASDSLVLVYDEKRSTFMLERVSNAIDFNLVSGSTQTTDEVRRHPQLPTDKNHAANRTSKRLDDDTPDASNPYDFRNFLSEAKENAEKATLHGSNTPLPGSRTPMSGFASPVPGATRFSASTPQARPSTPVVKKAKLSEPIKRSRNDSPRKTTKHQHASSSKPASSRRQAQPLSQERVSESSDDEISDTITVKTNHSLTTSHRKSHTHARNVSDTSFGKSPHIVVNDGDLEIDMGSPPDANRGRKRERLDPEAFRSHTGTPTVGRRPTPSSRTEDVRMKDIDSEEDEDVDELELGSPRTSRLSMTGGSASASVLDPASASASYKEVHRVPTPLGQTMDEEEDDDFLAQELEAAMEEEDNDQGEGYGLGISGTGQKRQEDESDVSEEE